MSFVFSGSLLAKHTMTKGLQVEINRIDRGTNSRQVNRQGVEYLKSLITGAGMLVFSIFDSTLFCLKQVVLFVYVLTGWTDCKGMFVVYPTKEYADKCKELLPHYEAWKAVEKVHAVVV